MISNISSKVILEKVFSNLYGNDLLKIMLCCKRFKNIVEPIMYSTIYLHYKKDKYEVFCNKINKSDHLKKYIKRLIIKRSIHYDKNLKVDFNIISKFNNLEHLSLGYLYIDYFVLREILTNCKKIITLIIPGLLRLNKFELLSLFYKLNLDNLQVLDISCYLLDIRLIPNIIKNMKSLKKLIIKDRYIDNSNETFNYLKHFNNNLKRIVTGDYSLYSDSDSDDHKIVLLIYPL